MEPWIRNKDEIVHVHVFFLRDMTHDEAGNGFASFIMGRVFKKIHEQG